MRVFPNAALTMMLCFWVGNSAAAATISYVFVGDINGDGDATNDGIPATGSVTLDGVNTSDPSDVSNVTLGAWEYSLIHGGTGEIVSFSSDDPGATGSIDPSLIVITASSLSFDLAAMSGAVGSALFLRFGVSSILTQTSSTNSSPTKTMSISRRNWPCGDASTTSTARTEPAAAKRHTKRYGRSYPSE